jgi:nucleotide-binding universal stress UspA family protein
MAKRILVPLEQTVESEASVPLVRAIARDDGATVRLLHVAPSAEAIVNAEGRVVVYADQETARLEAEGIDYLRTVEIQLDGIPVECQVRFGDPVAAILDEAEVFEADLIAMATTGRHGIGYLRRGSVAQEVLRTASVAVMVVRPTA